MAGAMLCSLELSVTDYPTKPHRCLLFGGQCLYQSSLADLFGTTLALHTFCGIHKTLHAIAAINCRSTPIAEGARILVAPAVGCP